MTPPKDPPTLPRNNGSGGTDGFQLHTTFWIGMVMCDPNGSPNPDGGFDNTACLNTVCPEPVNFAFVTKSDKAMAPANPGAPQHFIPDNKANLLMDSGDHLTVHLFDTPAGLKVTIADHTTGATGSMTASKANGFGTVAFNPSATKCTIQPFAYHPEFSTSTPLSRNVNAAHTYNVAFSEEIGHFEQRGRVNTKSPIGPVRCRSARTPTTVTSGRTRRATTTSACPRRSPRS